MSLQARITGFLHPERVNTPTPATEDGLKSYDRDDPVTAVFKAWNEPGRNLVWHRSKQDQVRAAMPLLARALDRLGGKVV